MLILVPKPIEICKVPNVHPAVSIYLSRAAEDQGKIDLVNSHVDPARRITGLRFVTKQVKDFWHAFGTCDSLCHCVSLTYSDKQVCPMSPLNRIFRQPHVERPKCPVCNESVALESCKADEDGQAIHEECYVEKVRSKTCAVKNEHNKTA